jgi:hypothetical protein
MTLAGVTAPGSVPGGDLFSADWLQVPAEEGPVLAYEVWQ